MKKLLLLCFIALGFGINAQTGLTIYSNDFESATNGSKPSDWVSGWFGSATAVPAARNDFMVRNATDCAGNSVDGTGQHLQIVRYASNAFSACLYGTQTGTTYKPLLYKEIDARDYNNIIVDFDWLCQGQTGQDYGRLAVSFDEGVFYWVDSSLLGASTKQHMSINLSDYFDGDGIENINFKKFYIGFVFEANNSVYNAPSLAIDNFVIKGDKPTVAPNCTTFVRPTNGATIDAGAAEMGWNIAADASAYKLAVGTTPGASNIFNETVANTYTYVPLAVNSTYYARLVPTNAIGDAVGCPEITFTTNNTISYCPAGADQVDELISRVRFADIDNSSTGGTGYQNWTAVEGNVRKGKPYLMTVNLTPAYTGDVIAAWIDYDNNGAFTSDEKVILEGTAASPQTKTITIPNTAVTGKVRMRVRVDYQAADIQPCGYTTYGEVEDYTLNIWDNVVPSCVTVTVPNGAAMSPANITWQKSPVADGYKLYIGTTSGGTDIVNGTSVTATTYSLTVSANTTYYVKVVPYNDLGDAVGCTESSFTTAAVLYCAATHATINADRITNVTFAGINNSSTTSATGGYSDYTAIKGGVKKGDTYPMTVAITSGNANDKAKVWIDYNQDGNFTDDEMTELTKNPASGAATSATGNITIPATALNGDTRMRIRMSRQASAATIVACGNLSAQGETEDYTLNIAEIAPACTTLSSPANSATGVSVNPTLSWTAVTPVLGYKLSLGTTSGGTEVLNNVNVTTGTSYNVTSLANNTTYYAKVVSYNAVGDATGCTETTFTTIAAAPSCTTITSPADGATGVAKNVTITWNSAAGATGYKVYIGTSSGGTNVVNGTEVATTQYAATLLDGTQYFVKIVPTNAGGDATGCTEISFTTAAAAQPQNLLVVDLSVTNRITVTATAGLSFGTVSGDPFDGFYLKDFLSNAGTVTVPTAPVFVGTPNLTAASVATNNNPRMYRASSGADPGFNIWGFTAATSASFTAGQLAFTGSVTWTVTPAVYNAAMTAPTGGDVYYVADGLGMLGTATLIGKYTVVKTNLATIDVNKNNISVYPNPFTDVLKISDVTNVKSISVNDMSGRQVKTLKPAAELNLSSLISGTYIVTLHMKDGSVKTIKVIKK